MKGLAPIVGAVILLGVLAGGYYAVNGGLLFAITYPVYPDISGGSNQFVAFRMEGETQSVSSSSSAGGGVSTTFLCNADKCIVTGYAKYRSIGWYSDRISYGDTQLIKGTICNVATTSHTEYGIPSSGKTITKGPLTLSKGESACLAGYGSTSGWTKTWTTLWMTYVSANFLDKCPGGGLPLQEYNFVGNDEVFEQRSSACGTGAALCNTCPSIYSYCRYRCKRPDGTFIYDAYVDSGANRIANPSGQEVSISSCSSTDLFQMSAYQCASGYCGDGECRAEDQETTVSCPEDCLETSFCGDGIIEGDEECEWNNLSYCETLYPTSDGQCVGYYWESYGDYRCRDRGVIDPSPPGTGEDIGCTCVDPTTQPTTRECDKSRCNATCEPGGPGDPQIRTEPGMPPAERYCQDSCTWGPWIPTGSCDIYDTEICDKCGTTRCELDGTWGDCLGQKACNEGEPDTFTTNHGCEVTLTCGSDCYWPTIPEDECFANVDKKKCIRDAKNGFYYCQSDCFYSDVCDNSQSECAIGEPDRTCELCGTQTCVDENGWSVWDECIGQGICRPGVDTTTVYGTLDCEHTVVCQQGCEYPSEAIVDTCLAGTTISCDDENGGIPSNKTCNFDCLSYGPCIQLGDCVPGATSDCGECGSRICNENGKWDDCDPDPEDCTAQFECAEKTADPGTTMGIFSIFFEVFGGDGGQIEGNYYCFPLVPIITPILDPNGYAVNSPIDITVTVKAQAGESLRGIAVNAGIYELDGNGVAISNLPISTALGFTDTNGVADLSFSPQLETQGTYEIRFTATVGGEENTDSVDIDVKGKIIASATYDAVQYYNDDVTLLLKFKDEGDIPVTDIASLVVDAKVGSTSYNEGIKAESNGYLLSWDVNTPGTLNIDITYRVTVNAKEEPLSYAIEVKQPFPKLEFTPPNDIGIGSHTVSFRLTNPQNEPLQLSSQELKVTLVRPDDSEVPVTVTESYTSGVYTFTYDFPSRGVYYYKIQISKPPYEQRIYGESPWPVYKTSVVEGGGGGEPGIFDNTLLLVVAAVVVVFISFIIYKVVKR